MMRSQPISRREQLLSHLEAAEGAWLSGERLAAELGVSRAAVWKLIRGLETDGIAIEARPSLGYRLDPATDPLCAAAIARRLTTREPAVTVEHHPLLDSTNRLAARLARAGAPEGHLVTASAQSSGRGRCGRSFISPPDTGVYFSLILRPRLAYEDALLITTTAAVAVSEAIRRLLPGLNPEIKWVNDILLDGRKVCGILTEASLDMESGSIAALILGIGINVYPPAEGFPAELASIAGALVPAVRPGLRASLIAAVVDAFFAYYPALADEEGRLAIVAAYRARCPIAGRAITVVAGDGTDRPATALGIDDRGRLNVRYDDGGEDCLGSGEIRVRPR